MVRAWCASNRRLPVVQSLPSAEISRTNDGRMILTAQQPARGNALTCGDVVELRGVEPRTSSMRTKRATNCATAPSASSSLSDQQRPELSR